MNSREAAGRWARTWRDRWEALADATLAGTSMLRFDANGLVIEQWDAWNVLTDRRDPPAAGTPFALEDRRDT